MIGLNLKGLVIAVVSSHEHDAQLSFCALFGCQCYENLKDLDLAYKLDALLNFGNNRSLLGYSYKIGPY